MRELEDFMGGGDERSLIAYQWGKLWLYQE